MTQFVLDTDILSLYQDGHPTVTQNVLAHPMGELAVTIISVEEQLIGWHSWLRRGKSREARARIYQRFTDAVSFLSRLRIMSFTEPAMIRYEQLRVRLRNVGGNDLRIAAIVLEANATLVTRNLRDFRRVPGLRIEDWSK
jgi:tRNA(fMet)-specific endonuclease VapC